MMSMAESYSKAKMAEVERRIESRLLVEYTPGSHKIGERKKAVKDRLAA